MSSYDTSPLLLDYLSFPSQIMSVSSLSSFWTWIYNFIHNSVLVLIVERWFVYLLNCCYPTVLVPLIVLDVILLAVLMFVDFYDLESSAFELQEKSKDLLSLQLFSYVLCSVISDQGSQFLFSKIVDITFLSWNASSFLFTAQFMNSKIGIH